MKNLLINSPFQKHRTVWSVSKINTLLQCRYKFKLKYLLKVPEEQSIYLSRGLMFHEMQEEIYNDRLSSVDDAKNYITNLMESFRKQGQPLSGKGFSEKDIYKLLLSGFRYSIKNKDSIKNLKILNFDDGINKGTSLEMPFRIPIVDIETGKSLTSSDLMGFVDIIFYSTKDGLVIKDFKMVSAEYSGFTIKTDIQLAVYAYALYFLVTNNVFPDINVEKFLKKQTIRTGFEFYVVNRSNMSIDFSTKWRNISFQELKQIPYEIAEVIESSKIKQYPHIFADHCNYKCSYKNLCLKKIKGHDIDQDIKQIITAEKLRKEKIETQSLFDDLENGVFS